MNAEPKNLRDKPFWDEQVKTNTNPYAKAVINAARDVLISLDASDTLEIAYKKMYGHGLSGFQAGCVASIVFRCHNRGDEFRAFWNHSWGVNNDEGTVNPAIFEASEKGTAQ